MKQTLEVKNRGYGFLIPIGKMLTQHEEKNDVRFLFSPVLARVVSQYRSLSFTHSVFAGS